MPEYYLYNFLKVESLKNTFMKKKKKLRKGDQICG